MRSRSRSPPPGRPIPTSGRSTCRSCWCRSSPASSPPFAGEADEARVHTQRRAPAWLSERVAGRPDGAGRAGLQPGVGRGPARLAGRACSPSSTAVDLTDRWRLRQPAGGDLRGARRLGAGVPRRRRRRRPRLRRMARDRRRQGARAAVGAARRSSARPCSSSATSGRSRCWPRRGARPRRRGEVWWLSETIRLQALADRRFGDDGSQAAALLDEAERWRPARAPAIVLPASPPAADTVGRSLQAPRNRPTSGLLHRGDRQPRQIPTTEENHHEHPLPPQQPQPRRPRPSSSPPRSSTAPFACRTRASTTAPSPTACCASRAGGSPDRARTDHAVAKIDGDGHRSTPDRRTRRLGPV